jgi:hypothetical protein
MHNGGRYPYLSPLCFSRRKDFCAHYGATTMLSVVPDKPDEPGYPGNLKCPSAKSTPDGHNISKLRVKNNIPFPVHKKFAGFNFFGIYLPGVSAASPRRILFGFV